MKNNVSSSSLKALLDSYDRDVASGSRQKVSNYGAAGRSKLNSLGSTMSSTIPGSSMPTITASDAKSLMNAYYKPFLHEAKEAAQAEKAAQAAAKKAAKTTESASVPTSEEKDNRSWLEKMSEQEAANRANEQANIGNNGRNSKAEKEEKKPGRLAMAVDYIASGATGAVNNIKNAILAGASGAATRSVGMDMSELDPLGELGTAYTTEKNHKDREAQRQRMIADAKKQSEKSSALAEKYSHNNTIVDKGIRLAASGVGSMAPNIAVGLVPGAGTALSTAAIFGMGAGSGYQNAILDGATEEQAQANAIGSGAVSVAAENIISGFAGVKLPFGKGALDDVVSGAVGRIGNKTVRGLVKYLADAAGEGVEEVAEDILNPIVSRLSYGKKMGVEKLMDGETTIGELTSQLGEDFMGGFLAAAAANAAGKAINKARGVDGDVEIEQNETPTAQNTEQNNEFSDELTEYGNLSKNQTSSEIPNNSTGYSSGNVADTNVGNKVEHIADSTKMIDELYETLGSGNTITNKQAEAVLNDTASLDLLEEIGVVNESQTKAEQRKAVKEMTIDELSEIAPQNATEIVNANGNESVLPNAENAVQGDYAVNMDEMFVDDYGNDANRIVKSGENGRYRNTEDAKTVNETRAEQLEQLYNDYWDGMDTESTRGRLSLIGVEESLIPDSDIESVIENIGFGATVDEINSNLYKNASTEDKVKAITGKTTRSNAGKALASLLENSSGMSNAEFREAAYEIAEIVHPMSEVHQQAGYRHFYDTRLHNEIVDEMVYRISIAAGKGDGGYGQNTVGAAESKFDRTPGNTVANERNSVKSALRNGGMDAEFADELADAMPLNHEEISIERQKENAQELLDSQGIDFVESDFHDMVNRGETLNDEQTAAAWLAIGEYNKAINDKNASVEQRATAMMKRNRMIQTMAKNNTVLGRSLGFLGNQGMDGTKAAVAAQSGMDSMVNDALKNKGKKQFVEKNGAKVDEAVQKARNEAAVDASIDAMKELENSADQRIKEAYARMKAAERGAKAAERAADRAENRAGKRVAKAGDRVADTRIQHGSPAERLAKLVVAESKNKDTTKNGNAVNRMVSELFRLSKQTAPSGTKTSQKYSSMDMLREAMFNQEAYLDTFDKAKTIVENSLANEPETLALFEEWINSDYGKNGNVSEKLVQSAITQAVMEQDAAVNSLLKKLAFNDYDSVSRSVSNYIFDRTDLNKKQAEIENRISALDAEADIDLGVALSPEIARLKQELSNIAEMKSVISDTVQATLREKVSSDDESYIANTDRAANREIDSLIKDWQYNLRDIVKQKNGDLDGIREAITQEIVSRYGVDENSASEISEIVTEIFNKKVGDAIDSNMKQMLPELFGKKKQTKAAKSALEKFVDVARMGQYGSEDVQTLIASKWGIPSLSSEQTNRIMEIGDKMSGLNQNSKQYVDYENEIYNIMAENVGSTVMDKVTAWRYFAMLSAPPTHARNIIGNLSMGAVTSYKDAVAAQIENSVIKDKSQRTKSVLTGKDRPLLAETYKVSDEFFRQLSGGSKFNAKTGVAGAKRIFNNNVLETARKAVSEALEQSDYYGTVGELAFAKEIGGKLGEMASKRMEISNAKGESGKVGLAGLKNQFARSLAQQIKAKGLDASILSATDADSKALVNQMAEQAILDAKRATFHEDSKLADWLNRAPDGAKLFLDAELPFRPTPINIVKQGGRYSPAGLVKSLTVDTARLNRGDITINQYIDNISMGLTGTGIAAAGAILADMGLLLVPSKDDDKESFDNMQGKQGYSVQIGDRTYTVDWLAPAALPLLMGASVMQSYKDRGEVGIGTVLDAMTSIADPLIESTMLQSLEDTVESVRYSESGSDFFSTLGVGAATNYGGQFVPTALGQISRSVTENRKSNKAFNENKTLKQGEYFINKQINKIPFAADALDELGVRDSADYIDAWGRTQKNGNFAENAMAPWYQKDINETDADRYLDELYEELGGKSAVLPSVKSSGADDDIKLDSASYEKYATAKGQAQYDMIDELSQQSYISNLPAEIQSDIVSKLYSVANVEGNMAADPDWEPKSEESKKLYNIYKTNGTSGIVDYVASSKAFSEITDSNNPVSTAKDYAAVLDDLSYPVAANMGNEYQKLYEVYKRSGSAQVLGDYEKAKDRYSAAHKMDSNVSYADALDSLNFSPEESGYIYAMHSTEDSKARQAYERYGEKYAYYFMLASAAGLGESGVNKAQKQSWISQNIPAEDASAFSKLYFNAVKDW